MKIHIIETGNFKLDGGAMFGVVPKSIWQKTNPADFNNLVDISARSILIEDGDRLILIDTGLGDKQSDKFFGYYHLWGGFSLDNSLKENGFHRDDITDVFLTHLHFDHCGGAVILDNNILKPAFKNATFWSNQNHWNWATKPNDREKASFLSDNILPLQNSGQLKFINPNKREDDLPFEILFIDGHTEKQMIPIIKYRGKTLVFVADLVPTVGHIPLAYIPSYDTRPLISMSEKRDFLNLAVANDYYLFFEHDAHCQICTVKNTERGIRFNQKFELSEL